MGALGHALHLYLEKLCCVWGGAGDWHGGTGAPWSLCCVSCPWAEHSFHHTRSDVAIWYRTKGLPSPPPQLCPVVDWYLQNWARLNLFFIFVVYPTPLYSGNKILVGSLGWPWTPPYPSVSASKRAGITDIHHRVLPLQMLLIPGFCFRARKLAWWTCLVLCSSSECSPFFPLNSALSFHSFLFLRPLYWFRFMKQGSYNNYLPFTVCTRCRKQSHSHMLSIFPALQLHRAPEIPGRRGLYHLGLSPSRSQRREEAHLMLETTEPAVPGPWLIK